MAVVEDVFGSLMMWALFLVAGIILLTMVTRTTIDKERFVLQTESSETYGYALDSLLEVTEPNSMRSFTDLLGSVAYFRTDLVMTRNGKIHITDQFEKLLDMVFPDGNYYFEVNVPVDAIHMMFIVDGSDTMDDENVYLQNNYDDMILELDKKFPEIEFTSEVYILDVENSSKCDGYVIDCNYLDYNKIYFNQSYTVFDLQKHRYRLTRPPHFDKEEEVWKSDWETAMMTLVLTEPNNDLSHVKMFLPITDSLPSATQYFYPCPNTYAFNIMKRDTEILRVRNFVINPIFSTNSDPILYCDEIVVNQMQSLMQYHNGEVIINRDNFVTRIPLTIEKNLDNMRVLIGEKQNAKAFGLERYLPMPNGGLANAQLIIYEQES